MSAWSHLPNAVHIDRVLASMKLHPMRWVGAYQKTDYVDYNLRWRHEINKSSEELLLISGEAWTSMYANLEQHRGGYSTVSLAFVGWCVLQGLILFDDSAHLLESSLEELKILIALGHPYAALFLPARRGPIQIDDL